ncbi:MAG: hypothetical protein HQL01_05775 [Nitrospirae bacterium]|nr:hypothetical protein [Nitrospirota bacterium]
MSKTVDVFYICVVITIYVLLHSSGVNHSYGDNTTPTQYLLTEYKSPLHVPGKIVGYGINKTPPQYLLKEYKSPSGDIIVKHFTDDDNWTVNSEVWLYSAKNPSKKLWLYSYERDAEVLFSPNEKWLALNHRYGCDGTDAILFKQVKGLKYEPIIGLSDLAWAFFIKTHRKYKIPHFDHCYTEAVRWSSDSKSVMLQTYGHDDMSPKKLDPWYCIYDLKTKKMTLDFSVFNRDTYHPNGEAKGR